MIDKYTTIQGDTWDFISHKLYGTSKGTEKLIEANRKHIGTILFKSGIKLTVPQLEVEKVENLPPWR